MNSQQLPLGQPAQELSGVECSGDGMGVKQPLFQVVPEEEMMEDAYCQANGQYSSQSA